MCFVSSTKHVKTNKNAYFIICRNQLLTNQNPRPSAGSQIVASQDALSNTRNPQYLNQFKAKIRISTLCQTIILRSITNPEWGHLLVTMKAESVVFSQTVFDKLASSSIQVDKIKTHQIMQMKQRDNKISLPLKWGLRQTIIKEIQSDCNTDFACNFYCKITVQTDKDAKSPMSSQKRAQSREYFSAIKSQTKILTHCSINTRSKTNLKTKKQSISYSRNKQSPSENWYQPRTCTRTMEELTPTNRIKLIWGQSLTSFSVRKAQSMESKPSHTTKKSIWFTCQEWWFQSIIPRRGKLIPSRQEERVTSWLGVCWFRTRQHCWFLLQTQGPKSFSLTCREESLKKGHSLSWQQGWKPSKLQTRKSLVKK